MQKISFTIGGRPVAKNFFSNEFVIVLMLLPFFKTSGFDFIPGLSVVSNALILIELLAFGIIDIFERKTTVFTRAVIAMQIWIHLCVPLAKGNAFPSLFYLAGSIGLLAILDIGMSYKPKKMISALAKAFALMITLNTLLLIFKPDGFLASDGTKVYLFGLRTGFSLFIIPGLMFNLLNDQMENRKISILTIVTFIFGVYSLLNQWVATGIFQILIIIFLLVLTKSNKIKYKINYLFCCVLLLILDVSLTIFSSQFKIIDIISHILKKDTTLSGRTTIWAASIRKLSDSPFWGVGINDATVPIGTTNRPAHNQWLHIALQGGYPAMILLMIIVIASFYVLSKQKGNKWYSIIPIFFISIMVGAITEIQTYVPFFYGVFAMPFLLNKQESRWNNDE